MTSVWVVEIDYEGLLYRCAYATREAAEAAVREDYDGEVPNYISVNELEVVA